MKQVDKTSSGQGAQTVYRDKKGRKLDMLNEFMKQQDARAGKEASRCGASVWCVLYVGAHHRHHSRVCAIKCVYFALSTEMEGDGYVYNR